MKSTPSERKEEHRKQIDAFCVWTGRNLCNHLFLLCAKTQVLLNLFFSLFGISWEMPESAKESLLAWNKQVVGKRRKRTWTIALLCNFWIMWRLQNWIAFKNIELEYTKMEIFLCVSSLVMG